MSYRYPQIYNFHYKNNRRSERGWLDMRIMNKFYQHRKLGLATPGIHSENKTGSPSLWEFSRGNEDYSKVSFDKLFGFLKFYYVN